MFLSLIGAAALNIALLVCFVWTALVPPAWLFVLWLCVAAVWCGAAGATLWPQRVRGTEPVRSAAVIDQCYRAALGHYLKGHWADAEESLRAVLQRDPRDCDALLQLGAVYFRMGLFAESAEYLERCRRADHAGKWRWESARLLSEIAERKTEQALEEKSIA